MRSGPLVYIVIGILVVALGGVAALVLTENQISDRKDEVAQLRRQDNALSARTQQLTAYTQFQALREQEVSTVTALADSRFDWERVMRELSLVLPDDVWLTSLSASAAATSESSTSSGGGGAGLRSGVAGPALELSGCTIGHDGVAGFITALEDIDGVTRVGVESSVLAGSGSEAAGSESGGCEGGKSTAQFAIVVAFDAAPVSTPPTAEAVPEPAPESGSTEETTTPTEEG
ncbi:MAG: PilN domain-containing protein [Solirubrobacterales bacterium]